MKRLTLTYKTLSLIAFQFVGIAGVADDTKSCTPMTAPNALPLQRPPFATDGGAAERSNEMSDIMKLQLRKAIKYLLDFFAAQLLTGDPRP
jgi:hypothetical protein